jgi:small subunit ribosomal protein S21
MIIVKIKDNKSLEQALKLYKNKSAKLGIVKELRDRQEYVKPSVKRREILNKAKYVQRLKDQEEN